MNKINFLIVINYGKQVYLAYELTSKFLAKNSGLTYTCCIGWLPNIQ